MIQEHKAAGNTALAKKIRGMKRAESTKRVFQRCQAARHLTNKGGLTHVLVPANPHENPRTCETWERVDKPSRLAEILMDRNRLHFGQSKECTLTSPPLDFTMNFTATCARAEAILHGTYLHPQHSPSTNTGEESDHRTTTTTSISSWSCGGSDTTTDSDDETDTVDQSGHDPLHLQ